METRRMIGRLSCTVVILCALLIPISPSLAADWLQWRGPQGTGQSQEKSAPLNWSKTDNIKWRVALDGPGNSSPIVVGGKVFITHAPAGSTLRGLHCYDRNTGELLWQHKVEYAEQELS